MLILCIIAETMLVLLGCVFALGLAYALGRAASLGWYKSKFEHLKNMMRLIEEKEPKE
jgi:hypothetical protein